MNPKYPNWLTGKRGKQWTTSLLQAQKAGAVICVEETGEPVHYSRPEHGVCFRLWITEGGDRYDSRECTPVF